MIELKRGDLVLIDYIQYIDEAIFLAYIENARSPYVCVDKQNEDRFHSGNTFRIKSYEFVEKATEEYLQLKEKSLELEKMRMDFIKRFQENKTPAEAEKEN